MNAIDLFSGLGGFSTGAAMAGVKVVWAANHWRLAVDYHAANHPLAHHECQDLHQADWSAIPRHDIGLGSPSCVPATASIVMADGNYKQAADVQLGDVVLTHQGRGRRVVNVWRKRHRDGLYNLRIWGDSKEPTSMTGEHLVWVRRRSYRNGPFGVPEFVRADELRPGDYVAYPRVPAHSESPASFVESCRPQRVRTRVSETTVSAYSTALYDVAVSRRKGSVQDQPGAKIFLDGNDVDLWWLVGHYLGDGQARSDRPRVGWSIGGNIANKSRVIELLARFGLGYWVAGSPGNETVFTSSKHLYALVTKFGRLTHLKHLPAEVLLFPKAPLAAIVDGYLAADGNLRDDLPNPEWRATSVSLPLLQGIQRVCWQLGWSASLARQDYARKAVILGRQVSCLDAWGIAIKKDVHRQSRTRFDPTHVWRGIRTVTKEPQQELDVIDFEVEEDHTFCLPGVIVHNCQGFSKARGTHQPRHDLARSTMWAVVSCAEHHREDIWLVENVPEAMTDWVLWPSWVDAMQRLGYAVSPHVVDAADFGVPQNRERLFIVCTRSKKPLRLTLPKLPHVPIDSVIDWSFPKWSRVDKPGRKQATLDRAAAGRRAFGERFVMPYYGNGSGKTGRSVHRPIGTITTRDRWAVVDGNSMRMVQKHEARAAMGFPDTTKLPNTHKESIHLLGNAVCPPVPAYLLGEIRARA